MAISNLVLTQQIYSGETNGAHARNRDRVPLTKYDTFKYRITDINAFDDIFWWKEWKNAKKKGLKNGLEQNKGQ